MQEIQGYRLITDFTTEGAGFSKWAFAEKKGHEFFIKEFMSPRYPLENRGLSEELMSKKRKQCEDFEQVKLKLYGELKQCRTGNIMYIFEFFRDGSRYYAVTDKIEGSGLQVEDIAYLSIEKKLIIMRALMYSYSVLHSHHIVHADVRPENILIKETASGYYTTKIIDFDASYLEEDAPEEIFGDMVYFAPESRLRTMGEDVPLTTKVDIFALGILLHRYWTGQLPQPGGDCDYAFEAVLDGKELILDKTIPIEIGMIIQMMLQKEAENRPTAAEVLRLIDKYCKDVIKSGTHDATSRNKKKGSSELTVPTELG